MIFGKAVMLLVLRFFQLYIVLSKTKVFISNLLSCLEFTLCALGHCSPENIGLQLSVSSLSIWMMAKYIISFNESNIVISVFQQIKFQSEVWLILVVLKSSLQDNTFIRKSLLSDRPYCSWATRYRFLLVLVFLSSSN